MNAMAIIMTAFMIWKGLGIVLNNESPIVVVLSESMSPAFERGDILFLAMTESPLIAGDICVFTIKGKDIPIVHRIIKVHEETGKLLILTKGDHNKVHDRGLYNRGQLWISKDDVVARVYGYVPFLGMITIIMNDFPQVKYVILGLLASYVLLTRE